MKNICLFILAIFMIPSSSFSQDNWSQFRGAKGDGTTTCTNLPTEWSNDKNVQWKIKIPGKGWASPIVWGDKVFIATAYPAAQEEPPTLQGGNRIIPDKDYRLELYCLNRKTGDILWSQLAYLGKPGIITHTDNTYASETPATDGKHVYVYFGMVGLYCFDMDGNKVWEKNLGVYPMEANWGTSSSPILYKDKLIMQFDNEENSQVIAMNKMNGEEIWRTKRSEISTWSTPYIWKNKIRTELVTGGKKKRSYDPESGKLLWELDMKGGRDISTPISNEDMIFMCNEARSDGGGILFAVKAGATGDISLEPEESSNAWVAWTLPKSGIAMASPVLCNGYIYALERRMGRINCINAQIGAFAYQKQKLDGAKEFWASPWTNDNLIFCLADTGTTHVLQAGPEFKLVATNKLDDLFWSSAAISDGILILRGVDFIYGVGQ
jgi:outer membrane protein assembly factor BamB